MKLNHRIPFWTWLLWLSFPLILWWAWRDIPLAQVWQVVRRLQAWQLVLLAILDGALVLLFSLRWWLILRVSGFPLPYLSLSAYRLASFAISYLTPGTQFGGEPLQVALLHRRNKVPASASIASVTLDKLLELLVNFLVLLFTALVGLTSGINPIFRSLNLAWVLVGLLALPALHLIMLWQGKRPVTAFLTWFARRLHYPHFERFHSLVQSAEDQMGGFCRLYPLLLGQLLIISLAVWVLAVLEHWLVYAFLGLTLPFTGLMALVAAMRLAFLAPLPGGLGVLEASQVWALGSLGMLPAYGVGAVLWIRLRDFILAGTGACLAVYLIRNEAPTSQPLEAGG